MTNADRMASSGGAASVRPLLGGPPVRRGPLRLVDSPESQADETAQFRDDEPRGVIDLGTTGLTDVAKKFTLTPVTFIAKCR